MIKKLANKGEINIIAPCNADCEDFYMTVENEKLKALIKFFAYFFGFYFMVAVLRCFTTAGSLMPTMYQGYHIVCALIFACTCALWKYDRKNTILSLLIALFWCGAALCKIGADMVLSEREIIQTIEIGIAFYAIFSVIWYPLGCMSENVLRRILKIVALILFGISILPALLVIGYYVVSDKHMLSANILLTLFQTNYDEVVSYLVEQNVVLWAVSVMAILLIVGGLIYFVAKIGTVRAGIKVFVLNLVFLLYLVVDVFPKLSSSFVINMIVRVAYTLREYKEYNNISKHRQERIEELKQTLQYDESPQLHVVVVGESTNREHLSAFGYKKPTTPWLDELVAKGQNVVLFNKAYSNNIQTVMSVQYALTSQNQYDNSELANAYSVTEVASAAGYDTYWISNQMYYSAYDTPISTIANGADHQVFINDFWGNKLLTEYYDDKLAEYFPQTYSGKKIFVIFHLMGCHNVYTDRYPSEYEAFTGGDDARIDAYDNCVRYNDHVLSLLYQKAVEHPYFMSFTFLSDHGEDPDHGLTHDYSKFTWTMAHIPFFSVFSDKYVELHPEVTDTLQNNADKYWTSDLLYNEILHILGIENAPGEDGKYDISSASYNMSRDNLTIIEGQKYIKDDDSE